MAKAKFPYTEKNQKTLDEGERIAKARYWTDLRSRGDEIISEHQQYDTDVSDLIHQAADRAVIYDKDAITILEESDNWRAIDDVGEIPQEASTAITVMAYYAYHQDLSEVVYEKADEKDIELNPKRRPNPKRRGGKKASKRRTKKSTKKKASKRGANKKTSSRKRN